MADEDGILDPVTYVILLDSVQEGALKNDTALAKGTIIAGRPNTWHHPGRRPGLKVPFSTLPSLRGPSLTPSRSDALM